MVKSFIYCKQFINTYGKIFRKGQMMIGIDLYSSYEGNEWGEIIWISISMDT
jgi:hypothetical protein